MKLIEEKEFDAITVQEVLDRAGVGRATFYRHYRDKDDLFLSEVEEFFMMVSTMLTRKGADARRLVPVAELFRHVGEVREFYMALKAAGKVREVQELGRGMFARAIAERLRLAGAQGEAWALTAQGEALAGSLFALLDWWLEGGLKVEAGEMDRLFHEMAWGGVGGALGGV